MSKSLKRVTRALLDAGLDITPLEMPDLTRTAQQAAETSGAEGIRVNATRDIRTAEIEGNDVFIEAAITVEASGRPRIAV